MSRLKPIFNRRENLWTDTETDTTTTSSSSDNEEKKSQFDENNPTTCCLICSILSNLSHINTCEKHLTLLNTSKIPSTHVVYMMHPEINHCHCRMKLKHRCRSISSSSSSESESRQHHRKKRSMIVQSSDTSSQDDHFCSPTIQPQQNTSHQSDHLQARLSPSLPPSSTINTNKNYTEILLTPFLQRNSTEIESIVEPSPDIIEIEPDLLSSPRIPLNRIVHVKDEDEQLNENDQKKTTINMIEATEQMFNHQYPQPIILLKRICLDK